MNINKNIIFIIKNLIIFIVKNLKVISDTLKEIQAR